jgi:hypothetical protein
LILFFAMKLNLLRAVSLIPSGGSPLDQEGSPTAAPEARRVTLNPAR